MNEELAMLKNKDKLSQYDIERAEKRLSILEAEIALEEARNSKTEMRLVRGVDGSYSYEYVANQEKILEAEEKLQQANQDLVKLDTEAYEKSLEEFYSMYAEFMDQLREASKDGVLDEYELEKLDRYKVRLNELASDGDYQLGKLTESVTDVAHIMGESASSLIESVINPISTSGLAQMVETIKSSGIDSEL
jgi:hypothetical protein